MRADDFDRPSLSWPWWATLEPIRMLGHVDFQLETRPPEGEDRQWAAGLRAAFDGKRSPAVLALHSGYG
jgi:hypothetical protein